MMNRARFVTVLIVLIVGVLYWLAVCEITGAKEPWDSDTYWRIWYPVSLGLSAVAGYILKRGGWLAGAVLTFAQSPVMWLNNGTGSLFVVGLLFLCVLAVPSVAISLLSGRFAMRVRSA